MFKIFKNKAYVVLFTLFFSLVLTWCVYGSYQRYAIKATAKAKITSDAQYALISKCEDRSTDMKEIDKAYKAYKEALKISTRDEMVYQEKCYNDFKEDYYEYMSLEQQKDMESAYRAFIKAGKVQDKTFALAIDVMYKLAKVDRSYYKVKKSVADYRIEKAKKHFDKMKESLNVAVEELNTTGELLFSKRAALQKDKDITFFQEQKKLWEESK